MKIAAITEDGSTISQHFGRAPFYLVVTVEGGEVVNKETRAKAGHHTFASHQDHDLAPGEKRGFHEGAEQKHRSMAESISDCQVLLAGGMGWGAYESMRSYNIAAIITDVTSIDEAVQLYLDGKLTNRMERLH